MRPVIIYKGIESNLNFKENSLFVAKKRIETHLWSYHITLELFSSTLFILDKIDQLIYARIENIISRKAFDLKFI